MQKDGLVFLVRILVTASGVLNYRQIEIKALIFKLIQLNALMQNLPLQSHRFEN